MKESIFLNGISLILFFIFINLTVLSIVVPGPLLRYLAPLFPFFAMIIGLILGCGMRIHSLVGIGIFVIMVIFGPMKDFVYEITHDYNGPIEGIVKHLNEHENKADIVAITYGDLPVKF